MIRLHGVLESVSPGGDSVSNFFHHVLLFLLCFFFPTSHVCKSIYH